MLEIGSMIIDMEMALGPVGKGIVILENGQMIKWRGLVFIRDHVIIN